MGRNHVSLTITDKCRIKCMFFLCGNPDYVQKFAAAARIPRSEIRERAGGTEHYCRIQYKGEARKAIPKLLKKIAPHKKSLRAALKRKQIESTFEIVFFSSAIDFGDFINSELLSEIAKLGIGLTIQSYLCSNIE